VELLLVAPRADAAAEPVAAAASRTDRRGARAADMTLSV